MLGPKKNFVKKMLDPKWFRVGKNLRHRKFWVFVWRVCLVFTFSTKAQLKFGPSWTIHSVRIRGVYALCDTLEFDCGDIIPIDNEQINNIILSSHPD